MNEYLDRENLRVEEMLTRFLVPMLSKGMRILSVGCGAGSDVLHLRKLGFEAFGVDPSRLDIESLGSEFRNFFFSGDIQTFARTRGGAYDFIYALDVIEHVGCRNFGTVLEREADDIRAQFLQSCLSILTQTGRLVMTTPNKNFLLDFGHWHRYHWLGKKFRGRSKFGISIPWHKENFLLSGREIRKILNKSPDFFFRHEISKSI